MDMALISSPVRMSYAEQVERGRIFLYKKDEVTEEICKKRIFIICEVTVG
jgi:hypothetical protein